MEIEVIELSKKIFAFSLFINFITYGIKYFIMMLKSKGKKVKTKDVKPNSFIIIIFSIILSFLFSLLIGKLSILGVVVFTITIFFVQLATYRSAIKALLEFAPKIMDKFFGGNE